MRTLLFSPRLVYQPLIEIRIFRDAILHNLRQYQKTYPKAAIAPVLKSNAYGHGLIPVAEILDGQGLPFFVVDSFFEALTLRRAGIKTKILILGFNHEKQLLHKRLSNCSLGLTGLEMLERVAQHLRSPQNFHLKIDTGMYRQGILTGEIEQAMELIKSNPNLILEGLCTHLPDSENTDAAFTLHQLAVWNDIAQIFRQRFPQIKYFHVSNTSGARFTEADANVLRLGIGLYGLDTAPAAPVSPERASPSEAGRGSRLDLRPALEMRSIISQVKAVEAGTKIGYDLAFTAARPMRLATVPVGYFEGVDRRLSNQGSFRIGETVCPIVGRVSMNMTTIDVTAVSGVELGQEVVVISRHPADGNCVEQMANIAGCLQREILVHLPQSLRRIIV